MWKLCLPACFIPVLVVVAHKQKANTKYTTEDVWNAKKFQGAPKKPTPRQFMPIPLEADLHIFYMPQLSGKYKQTNASPLCGFFYLMIMNFLFNYQDLPFILANFKNVHIYVLHVLYFHLLYYSIVKWCNFEEFK